MTKNPFDDIFNGGMLGPESLSNKDAAMKSVFAVHQALHGEVDDDSAKAAEAEYVRTIQQQVITGQISEAEATASLAGLLDHGVPPQSAFDEFANPPNETGEQ